MAAIIDGSTYKGFWKLTADHTAANVWYAIPKYELIHISSGVDGGRFRIESDPSASAFDIQYDATCIDENGNALATSAAVANYISQNR